MKEICSIATINRQHQFIQERNHLEYALNER